MFIPVHTRQPASPQAQELALRIAELVREQGKNNPYLEGRDVGQAFQLARNMLRPEYPCGARSLPAVLGLIGALVLGVIVYLKKSSPDGLSEVPLVGAAAGVLIVTLGVVAVLRRRLR